MRLHPGFLAVTVAAAAHPRQTGAMDTGIQRPHGARAYSTHRRVRLSDMDAGGRVRLDAVARFLQDAAIDDVEETGWGSRSTSG